MLINIIANIVGTSGSTSDIDSNAILWEDATPLLWEDGTDIDWEQ